MGNERLATYYWNKRTFHVYGCWDKETPENQFDFYDVFEEHKDQLECVNEGAPFWEFPSRDEVIEFVDN